ncbi:hypothetical protein V494_05891 [Pseudogymnoascus sp. VKM F-4513 (FW-928)]|nr:hypothetical protein V494_05891 [Pseudogymnoascus sp. VKM F-4513 (FW-928)]
MIDPMKGKQTLKAAELQDGDIICFQRVSSTKAAQEHDKDSKNRISSSADAPNNATIASSTPHPSDWIEDAQQFYDYLLYRKIVHFLPYSKTAVDRQEVLDIEMSSKYSYDQIAAKVGEKINVDPTHLRFHTVNATTGAPKVPIKRSLNHTLQTILTPPYTTFGNNNQKIDELYFEVLEMSLSELDTKKNLRIIWLSEGISKEEIFDILVPKNGNVTDLISGLIKKAKLDDEETAGPIRVYGIHNNKVYKEMNSEYTVASISEYITLVAERIPEEDVDVDPRNFIQAFHFQGEPNKPHGIPFKFSIRRDEKFSDTRKRLEKRTGIKGKNFDKIKFAVVKRSSYAKPTYLEDDDILWDVATNDDDLLGLDHIDRTRLARNGAVDLFLKLKQLGIFCDCCCLKRLYLIIIMCRGNFRARTPTLAKGHSVITIDHLATLALELSLEQQTELLLQTSSEEINDLTMRLSVWACGLLASLSPLVSATALTYKLSANEKACFFSSVEHSGAKIAFYFAVQAGGSFDVDYEVVGPNEKIVMDGQKERQGDFVFTATEVGEYRFCFNNEMSTFAEKFVDFEITVENEERTSLPSKQGTSPEQTSALEESIFKLSGQLSTITRNQKYFRTRENRNFSTVRSTERRIFNLSVVESLMMIAMAMLQVFIVRFFFQGARKGYNLKSKLNWSTLQQRAMASISSSLSSALPLPKYTGEEETISQHAQQRGPRIVGAEALNESQIVLKVTTQVGIFQYNDPNLASQKSGPPPYGRRAGWRPRGADDFGDGGAFPEIPVAQYPMDMGRKGQATSNALAVQVDAEGKVKYDAIARRGHNDNRIVHASFKDLIPLRQRADAGDIDLSRPSEEEVAAATEKTKNALAVLVSGAVAAQKPKNVNVGARKDPTYVRYTPANQMGDNTKKNDRIMKIVERQQDPMEPPKFKHKKIPRGPPSPPPPVMHSPPRKLTAEDQEAWKIPPPVSNWKNPKGYTVPLDKRLAADGRGLQDVTINDKFAQFAEALFTADRHAREEVKQRAIMQQRLAEKEKEQKEDHLRMLAQKAREERTNAGAGRRGSRDSRSRSRSYSGSESDYSASGEDEEIRERQKARQEKHREEERKLRQSRMGAERRVQMMAREQNRDISEKVALGLAKPTQSTESMWDSRLFNQTSGFDTGFNEDQAYDKPLFAAQDAISSIYRPRQNMDDGDDEEAAGNEMSRIQKSSRFEVLGRGGFKGAEDAEEREGPVQFEKDSGDDPFNVADLISEVEKGGSGKRYGIQTDEPRASKRAKMDDDDEA